MQVLDVGEVQAYKVTKISEVEEVAEATSHKGVRNMEHSSTNPNYICPANAS